MVRGCHICEASEDSDSTEHVAVTPDQDQRIDLGASIASLRDVPIVDTDPSEDGWGIDDDLGASEDEASAKSVIEAVARAITNYGRRCRALRCGTWSLGASAGTDASSRTSNSPISI